MKLTLDLELNVASEKALRRRREMERQDKFSFQHDILELAGNLGNLLTDLLPHRATVDAPCADAPAASTASSTPAA